MGISLPINIYKNINGILKAKTTSKILLTVATIFIKSSSKKCKVRPLRFELISAVMINDSVLLQSDAVAIDK
jgi:hypothetical protein